MLFSRSKSAVASLVRRTTATRSPSHSRPLVVPSCTVDQHHHPSSNHSYYSTTTTTSFPEKKTKDESQTAPVSWRDPAARQYLFWNREAAQASPGDANKYEYLLTISPESIQTEARIVSMSTADDPANAALHQGPLPSGARVVGVGTSADDFDAASNPNVLFVSPSCPHAATVLPAVLQKFHNSIQWIHVRSAGIDFIESPALTDLWRNTDAGRRVRMTNAKGQFSSSLAEYVVMACLYFAKDLP